MRYAYLKLLYVLLSRLRYYFKCIDPNVVNVMYSHSYYSEFIISLRRSINDTRGLLAVTVVLKRFLYETKCTIFNMLVVSVRNYFIYDVDNGRMLLEKIVVNALVKIG